MKNLVGGAVSRNVTVSSAYIRKNFLRDPRKVSRFLKDVRTGKRGPDFSAGPGILVTGRRSA